MKTPFEDEPSVRLLPQHQIEWHALRTGHINVLVEAPVAATRTLLVRLKPHIREPIVWKQPQKSLELPTVGTGALVLEDVASLSEDEQTRLLEWLGGAGSRVQIVSTSSDPLFLRVTTGEFHPVLYYRLNVILLRVD